MTLLTQGHAVTEAARNRRFGPLYSRNARAVIGRGLQVRLGPPTQLDLKLRVAVRVLRSMQTATRSALGYVDVSVPARPALGYKHSTST